VRYTPRQLEIFVEAAGDCNFARAAARLGISQPAVSDHVRALERNLGAELFERRRGSTAILTEAGRRLLHEAVAVLEQGARLAAHAPGAARTVALRLFAGPHIADRILRPALPMFHRAHPDIVLRIFSEIPPDSIAETLQAGDLDLAVFTASASSLPADAEVLGDVPCVVAASRRLVGDGDLTADQVSRLPFALPLEGAPAGRFVDRALARFGVSPQAIVVRSQFLDVQQAMVEAGEAAALLFRESVEASPVRDELRLLTPDAPGLKRVLVTRRGDRRPEVQAVAAFVRTAIQAGRAGH
jgi:DNA-binding transcriptional LysR family regulator